jgi:hypothetical protein
MESFRPPMFLAEMLLIGGRYDVGAKAPPIHVAKEENLDPGAREELSCPNEIWFMSAD